MLRDSRTAALIVSGALLPGFEPLLEQMPHLQRVVLSQGAAHGHCDFSQLLAQARPTFEPAAASPDDVAYWLYSSGSTGPPKGTLHMHASLIQTAELYARPILGIREQDLVFSAPKLFFAYGLGNGAPMFTRDEAMTC